MAKKRTENDATAADLQVPSVSESDGGSEAEDDSLMNDRIVLAAEQCFIKYGVHRTRMEDIAKQVGLARPNLYRFVRSKEDLILSVILKRNEQLDEERRRRIPLRGPVGSIITESLVLGWQLTTVDEIEKDMISVDNIDIAARFVAAGRRFPRPEYWDPIFDYGRQRGELRRDLDSEMTRKWLGAISLMMLERGSVYKDEQDVRTFIAHFVTPVLLAPSDA